MRVRVEITTDEGRTTSASFEATPMPLSMLEEIKQQICSFLDTVAQCPHSSPQLSGTSLHSLPRMPTAVPREKPPTSAAAWKGQSQSDLTLRQRLEMFIKYDFDAEWFTSKDVKRAYEEKFDTIPLSTVSTYLARMYQEGILERRGNRNERRYRLSPQVAEALSQIASWQEHE